MGYRRGALKRKAPRPINERRCRYSLQPAPRWLQGPCQSNIGTHCQDSIGANSYPFNPARPNNVLSNAQARLSCSRGLCNICYGLAHHTAKRRTRRNAASKFHALAHQLKREPQLPSCSNKRAYFLIRRRDAAPPASMAIPNSASDAGSGTSEKL